MTPIETLLDWLRNNHYYIGNDLLEKVEELKEMEKEIIRTAYLDGMDGEYNTSEQYYNETFKSE